MQRIITNLQNNNFNETLDENQEAFIELENIYLNLNSLHINNIDINLTLDLLAKLTQSNNHIKLLDMLFAITFSPKHKQAKSFLNNSFKILHIWFQQQSNLTKQQLKYTQKILNNIKKFVQNNQLFEDDLNLQVVKDLQNLLTDNALQDILQEISHVNLIAKPKVEVKQEIKEVEITQARSFNFNDAQNLKKQLLELAILLNQQDKTNITSFVVRRFAIWSHITKVPEHNANITAIPNFPLELKHKYQTETASFELLDAIENSISLYPFWFYGHFLSSQVALKLGLNEVAGIIKSQLLNFIQKDKNFYQLKYQDGSLFIDKELENWLLFKQEQVDTKQQTSKFNRNIQNERDAFYIKLEHLQQLKNKPLMQSFAKDSLYKLENTTLAEWEPNVFTSLKNIIENNES